MSTSSGGFYLFFTSSKQKKGTNIFSPHSRHAINGMASFFIHHLSCFLDDNTLIFRQLLSFSKKIFFLKEIQYFCAVKEMITIPRSEYEQMKREIAEFQTMVRQLEEAIECCGETLGSMASVFFNFRG